MKCTSFSAGKLACPHVPDLAPYVPGKQPAEAGWTKLNTNENPYPPSPRVEETIRRELRNGTGLRRYPDPRSSGLREAVAAHHGLSPENVCIGNGSDDILNLLVRVFGDRERAVGFTEPGYSLYAVLAAIQGARVVRCEFGREMELDVERLASLPANLLFITSPNAPTGVGFAADRISALAETFPGILVVDEAYADFAGENVAGRVGRHRNLCVTRTFSKSYSLAGLRVGYALADAPIIGLLDRVRDSYNVNRLSQVAAIAALEDREYFREVIEKIKATREAYLRRFRELGWFTYDSRANFLFTEPVGAGGEKGAETAEALHRHLYENRVLVRRFSSHALTSGFLRISLGSESEMRTLMQHIETWPGGV